MGKFHYFLTVICPQHNHGWVLSFYVFICLLIYGLLKDKSFLCSISCCLQIIYYWKVLLIISSTKVKEDMVMVSVWESITFLSGAKLENYLKDFVETLK